MASSPPASASIAGWTYDGEWNLHISGRRAISKAIEDSGVSPIILSQSYADSAWCLDKVVNILDCRHVVGWQFTPCFYGVDPSDVEAQKGLAVASEQHQKVPHAESTDTEDMEVFYF